MIATVIISSTRAAAGVYPDRTGPVIAEWLRDKGFSVTDVVVVPDAGIGAALEGALGADLVITSGGTGLSPTDRAPEATRALLDVEIPGLAEAIRARGAGTVPTAVLSRGLAGLAGRTLVINLPGSTGGVRDGLAVLDGVVDHALDQIAGGDHRPQTHHDPGSGYAANDPGERG
jgi:molybdenum cofactor synthesis domain-containing protein